jgi:hypothetical protein
VIRDNPQAGDWVGAISLFAIVKGILIQIIMASRILYGMAVQKASTKVIQPSIIVNSDTLVQHNIYHAHGVSRCAMVSSGGTGEGY